MTLAPEILESIARSLEPYDTFAPVSNAIKHLRILADLAEEKKE